MARKDLSRTVIEGGRSYYNCDLRRASHGIGRARERAWLDAVRTDADTADAIAVVERPPVHKDFHDKLAVTRRWLDRQVGRHWNAVFGELLDRFDPRTTAGRHIVFDHMVKSVRLHPRIHERYPSTRLDRGFFVDDHGILRRGPEFGRSWENLRPTYSLEGGRAALTGRGWWQASPLLLTDDPCRRLDKCRLDHDWTGEPRHYVRVQALRPLTRDETRRIGSLAGPQRRHVVIDARKIAVVWPE